MPPQNSGLHETEMPLHQPHELHPPPPPGPHHRWLYSAEGDVSQAQAAELFGRFASSIADSGEVELGEAKVTLPAEMRAVVRHELLPRGELVVKVELMWNGRTGKSGHPITELLG